MLGIFFFISIDSALGKINKDTLSQQTLMELFVETLENRELVCVSTETPIDISAWKGLTFNKTQDVDIIRWEWRNLKGSLELKWLPSSTREALFYGNKLTGTLDFTCLPDGLLMLSVAKNWFYGSINLTMLPGGLIKLVLYKNRFSGKTDFSQLPKSLRELCVDHTELEGDVYDFDGHLVTEFSQVNDMRAKIDTK